MSDVDPEIQFGSLRLAWLEAFVLSVRYQKRTAAAAEMRITPGTISKHIANLESWYGGGARRLLMKDNMWPPILTDDGVAFLPFAITAVEAAQGLRRRPTIVETPPITQINPSTIRITERDQVTDDPRD